MAEDFNKDTQKRIAAVKGEEAIQRNLSAILQDRITKTGNLTTAQKELIAEIKGQKDLESKLTSIQEKKNEIIEKYKGVNKDIGIALLKQLEDAEELVKQEKQRKDLADEINGYYEDANASLYTSLGTMGDMLKAGTAIGAAMALFKGLTEQIGAGFKNTIGFASELNKELGMDGGQAMLQGIKNLSPEILFSRFSVEELNQATRDFAETMGTTAGLTNNMRNAMAEMTKFGVGGEDAAKLAQSFDSATGDSKQLTTDIKNMAKDAGVMASGVFKDLGAQQRRIVGLTEKEIKLLAKKTIELSKQGLHLSDMQDIANNMMDIESTMKAQSKARVMLQGKLTQDQIQGMSAMQAAALEFQNTGKDDALLDAMEQTKMSAEQFAKLGPRGQEIYAEAIGVSADKLAEMIQIQSATVEESGPLADAATTAMEIWERVPGGLKEATTGLIAYIAQMAILNTMQGRGTGIGNLRNLNPFKKKGGGGGGVPGMESTQDAGGQAGQAAQGSGGGLKSLADGLREMGDAKVLAGVGVVALAGPAFVIALPSIPFLLFMGKVKLKALEENFGGLGRGLAQMSQGALGALTMMLVGPALAVGLLAIPFLAFMSIPATGPIIQANFTALAAGLAAFGNPGTAVFVLIGIGLMALLGAAMIPFAYALSLLSPLVEAFGNIIVGVMSAVPPIIQAIADGFVTMLGAITPEAIAGLLLLGPALMLASVGMLAFSASLLVGAFASWFGGGLVDQIVELGKVGPGVKDAGDGLAAVADNMSIVTESMSGMGDLVSPMFQLSSALYSISGGLVAVAGAGLLAIPIFGAIAGLAALAPTLMGLGEFFGFGGGDSESSDSSGGGNAELLEEIKGLRSDIKAQPIVLNIDGKAVQKITRVQSRQSVSTRGFS